MNARLMLLRSSGLAAKMSRESTRETAEEADLRMLAEAAEMACPRCSDLPCIDHADAATRAHFDMMAAHQAARER